MDSQIEEKSLWAKLLGYMKEEHDTTHPEIENSGANYLHRCSVVGESGNPRITAKVLQVFSRYLKYGKENLVLTTVRDMTKWIKLER